MHLQNNSFFDLWSFFIPSTVALTITIYTSQYKYWKASEYVAQGNWDAAIKEIDEAIALSPNDGRYYVKRGYAYLGKGDDDKAMSDYKMMELYSNPAGVPHP